MSAQRSAEMTGGRPVSPGKTRFPELTLLSVVLMLLVIYSHATSTVIAEYNSAGAAYLIVFVTKKLCGVAVPGFLFLSGAKHVMQRDADRFSYGAFLLKKARRTIPPYVFWVVIYYLYFVSRGYFSFELSALARYIADGTLVAPMYFVIVILQFYLTMPLWRGAARLAGEAKPSPKKVCALLLVLILSAVVMYQSKYSETFHFAYSDRIFTSFLYFWLLGVVCGANYRRFKEFLMLRWVYLTSVSAVVAALHTALSYFDSRGMLVYGISVQAQIVFTTALLIMALCICMRLTWLQIPFGKTVRALDGAGYNIFLMHCLVLFAVDGFAPQLGTTKNLILRLVCAYTVPIAACVIYNNLKMRALGGRKRA